MARTGYHVVDISPWPFSASLSVMGLTSSLVGFFHLGPSRSVIFFFLCSLFVLFLTAVRWWGDIILESTYLGRHTKLVTRNLRLGMLLFILSEVFFFVSFFWAFFNSAVGEISMNKVAFWPPVGIKAMSPWKTPAVNTAVLVASGVTVTWAHKAVKIHNKCPFYSSGTFFSEEYSNIVRARDLGKNSMYWLFFDKVNSSSKFFRPGADPYKKAYKRAMKSGSSDDFSELSKLVLNPTYFEEKKVLGEKYWKQTLFSLGLTIGLGVYFSWLQFNEYYMASFTMADGIYGSTFYIMTGFHGMHVMVGIVFLSVCWFRTLFYHFSFNRHYFGFDAAVWYWHFVDGVWVALYGAVYIWGYL